MSKYNIDKFVQILHNIFMQGLPPFLPVICMNYRGERYPLQRVGKIFTLTAVCSFFLIYGERCFESLLFVCSKLPDGLSVESILPTMVIMAICLSHDYLFCYSVNFILPYQKGAPSGASF